VSLPSEVLSTVPDAPEEAVARMTAFLGILDGIGDPRVGVIREKLKSAFAELGNDNSREALDRYLARLNDLQIEVFEAIIQSVTALRVEIRAALQRGQYTSSGTDLASLADALGGFVQMLRKLVAAMKSKDPTKAEEAKALMRDTEAAMQTLNERFR
jgi:hypothetical protein